MRRFYKKGLGLNFGVLHGRMAHANKEGLVDSRMSSGKALGGLGG